MTKAGVLRRAAAAVVDDARELDAAANKTAPPTPLYKVLATDSFQILALLRLRAACKGRIPGANHALRLLQSAVFGIEISSYATIGRGVFFVHPVAIVIGGDSKVGDRVRFYGSNTLGTAKEDGYPTIEDDVVIGAGARILGPITVGARSYIGANAVVVEDVPPDSIAIGIPAKTRPQREWARALHSSAADAASDGEAREGAGARRGNGR